MSEGMMSCPNCDLKFQTKVKAIIQCPRCKTEDDIAEFYLYEDSNVKQKTIKQRFTDY